MVKLVLQNGDVSIFLRKFSSNSYEVELPLDIGISYILNIVHLYPYQEPGEEAQNEEEHIQWEVRLPIAHKL